MDHQLDIECPINVPDSAQGEFEILLIDQAAGAHDPVPLQRNGKLRYRPVTLDIRLRNRRDAGLDEYCLRLSRE